MPDFLEIKALIQIETDALKMKIGVVRGSTRTCCFWFLLISRYGGCENIRK